MLCMSTFVKAAAAYIPVRMKMTDEQPDFTAEDDVGCQVVGCQSRRSSHPPGSHQAGCVSLKQYSEGDQWQGSATRIE
jgi:hypothetical protein